MAYGTAQIPGVASLAKVWTINGVWLPYDVYGEDTNPTLEEVEAWLDDVSSMVNLALNNVGFVSPVPDDLTELKKAFNTFVNQKVADLCHAANSSGRFFTEKAIERGSTVLDSIRSEVGLWVAENVTGFEAAGLDKIPDFSGKTTAIFETV